MSTKDKTPLISVIIPVYNVEKFISSCIDSVRTQAYDNIEILLIDDGSEDKSGQICDSFAGKDARIKVIHKENGGLSAARNTGIEHAKGEWLTFVDSDDAVSSELIRTLYSLANRHLADISVIDPVHVGLTGSSKEVYTCVSETVVMSSAEAMEALFYQTGVYPSAWGKLYRKSLFEKIRFPEGKLFEDIAIMGYLFEQCDRIVWNKSKLYAYNHREGSITNNKFTEKDLFILEICDKYCDRYRSVPSLFKAANAYKVNCSLRVLLNMPDSANFFAIKAKCIAQIDGSRKEIIRDKHTRFKLKAALILYGVSRPLLFKIYPFIDRWR